MYDDIYGDFRRSHISILIKHIIDDDCTYDEKSFDKRPFDIRYKESRNNFYEDLRKFYNISNVYNNNFFGDKACEMFMDIVGKTFEDMLHLFFEAGMQSGVVLSLDLGLVGKTTLFEDVERLDDSIINNTSIMREILKKSFSG